MKRIDGTKKLLALEKELQDVSKKRTAVGYIRLILNTLLVVAFSVCWILNPDFGGIPERVILIALSGLFLVVSNAIFIKLRSNLYRDAIDIITDMIPKTNSGVDTGALISQTISEET